MHESPATNRLYIIARADLPIGLQAAQAAHAAFQYARDHWHVAAPWMRDSNWLVLVTIADEESLLDFAEVARAHRLPVTTVFEPDLAGAATAVAVGPGQLARRLCANLPLLGRELAMSP
jgi:peptidyl-tRNA hydrolase